MVGIMYKVILVNLCLVRHRHKKLVKDTMGINYSADWSDVRDGKLITTDHYSALGSVLCVYNIRCKTHEMQLLQSVAILKV